MDMVAAESTNEHNANSILQKKKDGDCGWHLNQAEPSAATHTLSERAGMEKPPIKQFQHNSCDLVTNWPQKPFLPLLLLQPSHDCFLFLALCQWLIPAAFVRWLCFVIKPSSGIMDPHPAGNQYLTTWYIDHIVSNAFLGLVSSRFRIYSVEYSAVVSNTWVGATNSFGAWGNR